MKEAFAYIIGLGAAVNLAGDSPFGCNEIFMQHQ